MATPVEVEVEAKGLERIPLRPFVTIVIRRVILQKNAEASEAKKLVLVLATSALVTGASKEGEVTQATQKGKEVILDRVPCIHYQVQFRKDKETIRALIDSGSEVNAMTPAYAKKLGLRTQKTDGGAQKINESSLDTFEMVIAGFQIIDKLGRARFFQETFLLADTTIEVVLGMPFLTLSNADIQFAEKELTWRTYTTKDALPTTQRVELIDKKEFAKAALDENIKAFVVHVSSLSLGSKMTIHRARKAQITLLLAEEVTVLAKYSDFADVFSKESAEVLPEYTKIIEHTIKLEDDKQPLYGLICSLGPVELKTLKIYIETNLANGFIQSLKSPAGALILFVRKPDGSLRLCVNYRGLNNLTIKNRYPHPLIGESLDWLRRAKQFTQLDLTSAYHRMRIKEGDKWKTAFITQYSHFEYQVMPFGLSNAPASIQGYINKILVEKLDVFVIVYLDDILIYIEDAGQAHVNAIR